MLENIEIVDYKCFKNLKLENLNQINIISGGNNVGKTALLEALFINESIYLNFFRSFTINPLLSIAKNRDFSNKTILNFLSNLSFKSDTQSIESIYKYLLDEEDKELIGDLKEDYDYFLKFKLNDHVEIIPIKKIDLNEHNINNRFINSSKPSNKDLVQRYSAIQSKGIQHKFLEYLKILDTNIAWIEPQLINEELLLRINLNNPEHSLISSELGEGVNRYIEILTTLLSNSNGSIFIDEIENGIHYTKLKDIWKAIIQIVQAEKMQLFVTTHDKETIEALKEASNETNYKNITSIKLSRDEENKIVPTIHKYDNFAYGIERGADLR